MSLQGSLETFALPDVLILLASTKKDGELQVSGDRIEGKVWLEKGQIVHTKVGAREVGPVDTVFELLRLDTGNFSFESDSEAPKRGKPQPIEGVLADAQVQLVEWREIAKVVPNLDAVVDMAASAPGDEVVITAEQWRLLRAVAGGRSVQSLMSDIGGSEFSTCKTVKELVDHKLASIDVAAGRKESAPPARAAAAPAKAAKAPAPEPDAEPPARPEQRQPAPEPVSAKANDALDALAELASRPRSKVRATTSAVGEEGAGPRPAAVKRDPYDDAAAPPAPAPAAPTPETPEEAKALVAQLAALGGEPEEKVAEKVAEHLAQGGELPAADGDEPINRGLLLKFLSSVRN